MLSSAMLRGAGLVGGLAAVLVAGCKSERTQQHARRTAGDHAKLWHFDSDMIGGVPDGWSIRETNPTQALASWQVVKDESSPSGKRAFALTASENYNGTYNLAVAQTHTFGDLKLGVQAKAVEGREDQGGGPIWRARDSDNYYICRFNPLESNYRVYVVSGGKRRQLDSANVELDVLRWYSIDVSMIGDQITCSLDGKKLLEVRDDTITQPGFVGLWTKADAVTSFDDLDVVPVETSDE